MRGKQYKKRITSSRDQDPGLWPHSKYFAHIPPYQLHCRWNGGREGSKGLAGDPAQANMPYLWQDVEMARIIFHMLFVT